MKNVRAFFAAFLATLMGSAGLLPGADRTDRLGDPLPPGAVQRFGTQRFRYRYGIRDAAYAWNSMTALVVYGQALDVWDLEQGKRIASQRVSDKGRELRLVAPSRRGPRTLVADADGTVFDGITAPPALVIGSRPGGNVSARSVTRGTNSACSRSISPRPASRNGTKSRAAVWPSSTLESASSRARFTVRTIARCSSAAPTMKGIAPMCFITPCVAASC